MQMLRKQCPICLKIFSSNRYLQKHIFKNKRRCSPPPGHIPPQIDFEKNQIIWNSPLEEKISPIQEAPAAQVVNEKPKQPEKVTNKYTIAVDTSGNMVDLPNVKTQNGIVENNPVLMEQIRQIVKNLNVSNGNIYKLPPEIDQYQHGIEEILEQFGDVKNIIESGLNYDMNHVDIIVSINYEEDNNVVYIEKITIPEDLRKTIDRPISFIEIIYGGLYSILTNLITHKFHFFEITHSKKAYDDCNNVMKYRKSVLISYIVLKYRLDKLCGIQQSNPERYGQIMTMSEKYVNLLTNRHLPHIHQYDDCFLAKLKMTSKLTPIELQSILNFYETFTQLFNVYEFKKTINQTCQTSDETSHDESNETEFKKSPDYQYLNLDHLSIEHKLFPDYDYEVIDRNFCSYLVKITPQTLTHTVNYPHPSHYYKRIYIDQSCDSPIEEQNYQLFKSCY